MDVLDLQMEAYRRASESQRVNMWYQTLLAEHDLFGFIGGGCPTMVKSGHYTAETPDLTEYVRGLDIPASIDSDKKHAPVVMTKAQLQNVASIQRRYAALSGHTWEEVEFARHETVIDRLLTESF